MNNLIDQIDAYLDGTMNTADRAAFETKMNSDASLREQVTTQQNLRAGIERMGMKAATSATFKKITLKNKLYKWGAATVAVAAIATSAYLLTNSDTFTDGPNITYELPATNEEGGTQWADADRNLPTQLFTINPNKDTVIETMGGIVFAIPAGAFIDGKDPMTIEVREALTPMDIMKGGLSTTSNGELLETGGMFYINARNGETSLAINPDKPVYANIPTNEIRPGMQLFEGERTTDGGINWVNPKQMEKQLIPVDIFSLNFYPDGFLEKCAELGFDANDRKVTDSIYYSYSGRQQVAAVMPPDGEAVYYDLQDGVVTPVEVNSGNAVPDGERLFKANCSSCHTNTDKPSTGPGLKGVLSRIPEGNWKYNWVHNSSELIKSGDPYATELYQRYKSVQTAFPKLTNAEIDAILGWADHGGKPYGMELDPARIAAIKSVEFQNTLIATKEFEERLQVIFSKCSPQILDLYVNNLDMKMYQIDSMAMNMIEGNEFRDFYARHDGGVAISEPHMRELQEYYRKKQEAVRIASQAMLAKRTAEQRKEDSIYLRTEGGLNESNNNQRAKNINVEFDINLKDAYRQLGLPLNPPPPAPEYYGVTVPSTGWKNVDVYVYESTTTRTTLDYRDTDTGKRAEIEYEDLNINIDEVDSYNQLMVYLVSDDLPCFLKVSRANGFYHERLNELMEYSLVVIAEKDGIWYSATTPKVTSGTANVTLINSDEASIRAEMNSIFFGKVGGDFGEEISYMKEAHLFNVRKEKEKKQAEIDRRIMDVIFPCQSVGTPSAEFQKVDYAKDSVIVVVTDKGCEAARQQLSSAKITASNVKLAAYKAADDARLKAYSEADRVEKSYKNPLELAAKKSAADAMRKSADEANLRAKMDADVLEKNSIAAAQAKVDQSCK